MGIEVLAFAILGTAFVTLTIMFLPAMIELRNPQDAGPRLINGTVPPPSTAPIANLEEEHPYEGALAAGSLASLPAISSLEV